MRKKMYWGIATLIILILGAGVAAVLFMYNTDTEPNVIYKYIEPARRTQTDLAENPTAREGVKDKIPIDVQDTGHDETSIGVTEKPAAFGKTDLSVYEGKPLDEDFFRDNYSREQLESKIKSKKKLIDSFRTTHIPQVEELRNQSLKFLQSVPDNMNEHMKKVLAKNEAVLNEYKGFVERLERHIAIITNVLNEEANNVEK